MQYKTVMGSAKFLASSKSELEYSVGRLANIINKEASEGWELFGMYPMSAVIDHTLASDLKSRALGRLTGEDGDYTINVMVFRKP